MKLARLILLGSSIMLVLACAGPAASGVYATQHFGTMHETFTSIGAQDGWIVGTGNYDELGSDLDSAGTGLRVGDENGYGAHQIRTIVSFDTSPLPDNAIITSVKLELRQESIVIGGGNPFQDFRGLRIDIKMGPFGTPRLEPDDFQAIPDVSSMGPYIRELADTYTFELSRSAYPYVNKWPVLGGLTQLRLHFTLDSDHNDRPNYIHFYSGDEPTEAWRPKLVVTYRLPSPVEMAQVP